MKAKATSFTWWTALYFDFLPRKQNKITKIQRCS